MKTDLLRGLESDMMRYIIKGIASVAALSPLEGAIPSLFCASGVEIDEEDIRDTYFVPLGDRGYRSWLSRDEKLAEKLWSFTQALINEKMEGRKLDK